MLAWCWTVNKRTNIHLSSVHDVMQIAFHFLIFCDNFYVATDFSLGKFFLSFQFFQSEKSCFHLKEIWHLQEAFAKSVMLCLRKVWSVVNNVPVSHDKYPSDSMNSLQGHAPSVFVDNENIFLLVPAHAENVLETFSLWEIVWYFSLMCNSFRLFFFT